MSYKRSTLLLFLALFAISTYAVKHQQDHHKAFECGHDHQERDDPELNHVDEEFNPNGNDHSGRTLADYNNIRMYGYYGLLDDSSFADYAQNKLIPPILDYFSAALKVKYPVSGLLKFSGSLCGYSVPAEIVSGVSADYIYYVALDSSSDYVASSTTCSLASGSKRPLAGRTTISTYYMSETTDVLLHERNMICIMHEMIHTLGFSTSLYGRWIFPNGTAMTGHILTDNLLNISTTVINAEPLTSKLRSFVGCSTMMGAYMENTGGSGTIGSHFERRFYANEIMTSGLIYQMVVSQFTLALLESTGWYVPDYTYADNFFFGKDDGCGFITGTCSASKYTEYCSATTTGCTYQGRGGGSCTADGRSDDCQFVHPNINYDCDNTKAANYARLPTLQVFGRGKNSKCFTGTLTSASSAGTSTSFCFNYTCSGTGTSTQITLNLNGKSVVCKKSGSVTVTGYTGTIDCPDPQYFCATAGAKICPRNCMGRGDCVNGVCQCDAGFIGADCGLPSDGL